MQAAELGIRRIFVPKLAPAFSALGLLSDRPRRRRDALLHHADRRGRPGARERALRRDGAAARRRSRRTRGARASARAHGGALLPGQTFDMPVALPARGGRVTARRLADTVERFHRLHEELHTYASAIRSRSCAGFALKAVAVEEKPALPRARGRRAAARGSARARRSSRPLRRRRRLRRPALVAGPGDPRARDRRGAVHDDRRLPGQRATVDAFGNYAIARRLGMRRPRTSRSLVDRAAHARARSRCPSARSAGRR
jgi:hypothetical protein